MLRVGLVGAGAIGRAHLATLLRIEGMEVQVVGVADPIAESAAQLAATAGTTAYTDYRALLGRVDAAWICAPTFAHPELTIAFAEAGANVFCEKPIALDLASADRMIAAVRQAGRQLMIGMVIRYYPETILIRQMLESGDLGDPVFVFGRRLFSRSIALSTDWRRDVERSGGMTLESGIHEVDTVRWLGGEVTSVAGRVVHGDPQHPAFDTDFRALLGLANGATGEVAISVHVPQREWSWGVVGSKATALSPRRAEVQVVRPGERPGETDERIIPVERIIDAERGVNLAMLAENQAFVDAIRSDHPVPIPGEEGRRDLEIVLATMRASRERQTLVL